MCDPPPGQRRRAGQCFFPELKDFKAELRCYIKTSSFTHNNAKEEVFLMKVKIGWGFIFFFAMILGILYVIYFFIHSQ